MPDWLNELVKHLDLKRARKTEDQSKGLRMTVFGHFIQPFTKQSYTREVNGICE